MRSLSGRRGASDSAPQRDAERAALRRISSVLGVRSLEPNKALSIGDGRVVLDGFYHDSGRVVIVEVNAHIGKMKSAQKHKVINDAFKLSVVSKLHARRWRGKKAERVLVFVDQAARDSFGPRSWATAAFNAAGITLRVCKCTPAERAALLIAQKGQDLRFHA